MPWRTHGRKGLLAHNNLRGQRDTRPLSGVDRISKTSRWPGCVGYTPGGSSNSTVHPRLCLIATLFPCHLFPLHIGPASVSTWGQPRRHNCVGNERKCFISLVYLSLPKSWCFESSGGPYRSRGRVESKGRINPPQSHQIRESNGESQI